MLQKICQLNEGNCHRYTNAESTHFIALPKEIGLGEIEERAIPLSPCIDNLDRYHFNAVYA